MKQTPNYTLKKIEISDAPADITVDSGNMDIIDTELKKAENHRDNSAIHVTSTDKANWNGKAAGSHSHTKSQITDFPSSLPANGGNADTVDGKHASDFLGVNATATNADKLDGKHASDFAPSGYGLGQQKTPYLSNANNAITTGFYRIDGSTANGLSAASVLIHHCYDNNFMVQTASIVNGEIYQRVKFNGSWGAWRFIK